MPLAPESIVYVIYWVARPSMQACNLANDEKYTRNNNLALWLNYVVH